MLDNITHADRVYTSAQISSAAASSSIIASWRRCMTMHRLAPEEKRAPWRLSAQELELARKRSDRLINEATGELDRLFTTVGRAGCCILLSDRDGVALERRGSSSDDDDFRGVGLWTGTVWTEASVGTNGIGTAIVEERAVAIFQNQHFLSSNIGLSCTTAPIRDHHGKIAAALDISTCRRDADELTLGILSQTVRDAAMRIEINLFRSAFPNARFVLVPTENNSASALLAVDRHDIIVGATRAARLALRLDDAQIANGIPASDALHETGEEKHQDLEDAERAAILRVLSRCSGNVSHAAVALGISRATMHRKLKKLGLH